MSHRKQRNKSRKSTVALMMLAGGLAVAALSISVAVYAQQPPPKGATGTGIIAPDFQKGSTGIGTGTAGTAPGTINPGAPAGALNSYITPRGPSGGGQGTGAGGGGPGKFSCATGALCPGND